MAPVPVRRIDKALRRLGLSIDWSTGKGSHGKVVDASGRTVTMITPKDLSGASVNALCRAVSGFLKDRFDEQAFRDEIYKRKRKAAFDPATPEIAPPPTEFAEQAGALADGGPGNPDRDAVAVANDADARAASNKP